MRRELLQIYIDVVKMIEGEISDYQTLANKITEHFGVTVTKEDISRFYDIDIEDIRLIAANLGINY